MEDMKGTRARMECDMAFFLSLKTALFLNCPLFPLPLGSTLTPHSTVTDLSVRAYTGPTMMPSHGEVEVARSQLVTLLAEIHLPRSFSGLSGGRTDNNAPCGNVHDDDDGCGDSIAKAWRARGRWDGFELSPPAWIFSPNGCSFEEVRARASVQDAVAVRLNR